MKKGDNMGNIYTLCGKKGCSCPQVISHEDGGITINDDYGGSVRLTKEELRILREQTK